jgi:sugar phosphate isomerase/epimerase
MAAVPRIARAAVTKAVKPIDGGLKLGIASYSFRQFPLDRVIEMTRQLRVKHIALKDMHLPFKTPPDERRETRKKLDAAGIVLMGGGVVYMNNNEPEIRGYFEYARDAGMPTLIASPDPAALDIVERMAKEFDIRVAIHNHGPGDRRYPSALDVLKMVQARDPHLGLCLDVGHTVRLGEDPIECIRKCAARLYDFHIKDQSQAAPQGQSVPVGQGVIDIVAVLKVLIEMKFKDHVALEYEAEPANPLPGMIESFAFMRGVLAAID